MTEGELVERLADKEHASWARWQAYAHSLCDRQPDGSLVIPVQRVAWWEHEIATPYAELPEHVKQYDRDEVAHILPIIREFAASHQQPLPQPPSPPPPDFWTNVITTHDGLPPKRRGKRSRITTGN